MTNTQEQSGSTQPVGSRGFKVTLIAISLAVTGFLFAEYAPGMGGRFRDEPFNEERNEKALMFAFFGGIGGAVIGFLAIGAMDRRPTRKCAHCAELIQAEARVCRYCGRDVAPSVSA
jgi:hypothetical protein